MAKVQIIRDARGGPAFAVVPWPEYRRLVGSGADDAEDAAILERARAENDEWFPAEVANRIAEGENVLRVIREWRGLTQAELAKKTGRATQYISQLETGKRAIGRKTAKVLAPALKVSADVLSD